jgi:septal ring factor EnvC (AmiA/AmiB activator)
LGDAMIKNAFFITLCIILSLISRNAHAVYFTIQLKNGNKIKTGKYWEEGQNIRFFIQGGYVELPNKIIKHIARSDGILDSGGLYYPPQSLSEFSEGEQLKETAFPSEDEQKADMINDIEDRISVTETNIENLNKNKKTYLSRREKYIIEKDKLYEKIEKLNKDSYITSKDLKERIGLQESKIADAEQKIKEIDTEIKRTEDMLASQKRMKKRLETELARLNR